MVNIYQIDVGDEEIDVFVSHDTPERKVLSKADTKIPLKKEVSSNIIDKCLMIIKSVSTNEDVKNGISIKQKVFGKSDHRIKLEQ